MSSHTRIYRGRLRTILPEVKLWRKRMQVFNQRKARLLKLVLAAKGEDAATWFKTVHPDLGCAPKALLKPKGICKLLAIARKL